MSQAMRMIETYPTRVDAPDLEALTVCVEECMVCGQACAACADACLAEDDVTALRACVRKCLDCADLCQSATALLSRHTVTTAR